jgi:hypothetical protein
VIITYASEVIPVALRQCLTTCTGPHQVIGVGVDLAAQATWHATALLPSADVTSPTRWFDPLCAGMPSVACEEGKVRGGEEEYASVDE